MKIKILIFCLILNFIYLPSLAAHQHLEKWYLKQWCPKQCGETEQGLEDGTRCDCVTTTHAIEFDFGDNWYEAVGQSLHYSLVTGKKAGIVLILESPKDRKYWNRLKHVIKKYDLPIRVWTMGPGNVNSIKK